MLINRILAAGLRTGAALAVTTTAAIMLAGKIETSAPWSPINAIAHIADGDDVSPPSEFSARESGLGLGINTAVMVSWGILYEAACLASRRKSSPASAILATAGTFIIDYQLLPPRLSPGIEKRLSRPAVLWAYAVLAATLALSPLWNDYDDTRTTDTSPWR
jgi:hypothetical protein